MTAFASVLLVLLFFFMVLRTYQLNPHYGTGPDLPRIDHAIAVPGAEREDAIVIAVQRDGRIWFGIDQIPLEQIPAMIQKRLNDGAPKAIYIRADARVRYHCIREVLESVRLTGIDKVVFLVDKRKRPGFVFVVVSWFNPKQAFSPHLLKMVLFYEFQNEAFFKVSSSDKV